MEVQRFPEDYDGVIAGAPANAWAPLLTAGLKYIQTLDHAGYIPAAKVPAIGKAVLAACDKLDGVADGVLNDPRQCHFDPAVLRCKGAESDECLTDAQVQSLKTIYAGAHDASGKLIFPPYLPGAEDGPGGWIPWVTGREEGKSAGRFFVTGYFTNMVYGDKDWDFRGANVDASLKLAYEKTGDAMDAMNPDIKPFLAHGGKLILYHGWNDPAIASLNTVNYFHDVSAAVGSQSVEQSVRLYMVPGMQHCDPGPGATSFGQAADGTQRDAEHDVFTSLVDWVESGKAPGTIIATKYRAAEEAKSDAAQANEKTVEMTRPLCAYPQVAKYRGSGDPDRAESFACVKGD
jgi:hypothetical protein